MVRKNEEKRPRLGIQGERIEDPESERGVEVVLFRAWKCSGGRIGEQTNGR